MHPSAYHFAAEIATAALDKERATLTALEEEWFELELPREEPEG